MTVTSTSLPCPEKAHTYSKVKQNIEKLSSTSTSSDNNNTNRATCLNSKTKEQPPPPSCSTPPPLSNTTNSLCDFKNETLYDDEGVLIQSRTSLSTSSSLKEDPVDPRYPLYLGEWERSIPQIHSNLAQDDMDEPHLKRKKLILQTHPEVKQLYGYEPKTKYIILSLVSIQLSLGYFLSHFDKITSNPWVFYVTFASMAYFIGGTITSIFGVLIHECSHNLAASTLLGNRVLGFITNIGIPFPIFASFRRYHLDHHAFQGVKGKDPDLPLDVEWQCIQNHALLKFIWVFCFPFLYVLRGVLMFKPPQKLELINALWTFMTDYLIYNLLGKTAFWYLFFSLWFGYGLHPGAAHFIQEHYTFTKGQETYSYYGIWNYPLLNIGYHNEHHDFTQIPWSNLPSLYLLAKEFYAPLMCHTSWVQVILDFIFRKDIGPQSRLARDLKDHYQGRATMKYFRRTESNIKKVN